MHSGEARVSIKLEKGKEIKKAKALGELIDDDGV